MRQIASEHIFLGQYYKGTIDETRPTQRFQKACEAVLANEMSVIHAAVRFGVSKDKIINVLSLNQ